MMVDCPKCDGTGRMTSEFSGREFNCDLCDGDGVVREQVADDHEQEQRRKNR